MNFVIDSGKKQAVRIEGRKGGWDNLIVKIGFGKTQLTPTAGKQGRQCSQVHERGTGYSLKFRSLGNVARLQGGFLPILDVQNDCTPNKTVRYAVKLH